MNQNTALNQNRTGSEVTTTRVQGDPDTPRAELAERNTAVQPPVDIFEDDAGFTVLADLPGVSRDRLAVRVDGDSLVIEGAAATPVDSDITLIYGEVLNPLYRRVFTLSRELDTEKIEAKLDNGVLKLKIPKAEAARPRRIEVALA